MPISVGNGRQIAPNLPKTKSKKKRKSDSLEQAAKNFKRDLGIDKPVDTFAFGPQIRRGQRRLNRTLDRLGNRRGLAKRLETRGVTSQEFDELRKSSNAHDRRILDQWAKRRARSFSKTFATIQADRRRLRQRLIAQGVDPKDARALTALARARSAKGNRVPGRISALGIGSIDTSDLGSDLVHRLGPVAPFAASIPRTAGRTAQGLGIIARETAEHPGKTGKGLLEMGLSGLAAVPELASETAKSTAEGHPLKPAKRLARAWMQDLKDRYGPLYDGDVKEFERRLDKQGTASELLDIASIVSAGGVSGGRALGAAARSGRLGRGMRTFATAERPGLQLAGATARRQKLSKNLGVVALQRLEDRARKRKTDRKAENSGSAAGGGDALAAAAREAGNVIPLNPRAVKRPIGRQKGAARLEQQALLDAEARSLRRARRILTREERDAYKYAVQYGIRSDSDIDEVLGRLAEAIDTRRRDTGFRPSARDHDELRLIDRMAENPRDYFTPVLDEIANEARNRALRAGRRDPTLMEDTHTRRARAAQAELLGVKRWEQPRDGSLPDLSFLPDRDLIELARRRRELGLAVGGYFPSRQAGPRTFAEWTMGSALRGPSRHRQYTGRLRELGIESADPELLDKAIARNINNQLRLREVTRTIQQQALPWSMRPGRLPSHTAQRLLNISAERGIDPTSWVAISPGALDKAAKLGGPVDEFDLAGSEALSRALGSAVVNGEDIARNPAAYGSVRGYVAIPRAVWDELRALEQPTTKGVRMWNNAKGGFSRAMLGLNPTWLPFQVAGNVVQTALSGAAPGRTRAIREALDTLTPEERRRADALLGIGQISESFNRQHLGSRAGALARSWQQLKETSVGRAAGKVNPVRAMFELDRRQNNMFRQSVADAKLRKLAREAESGAGVLDRILSGKRASADDYVRILRNPEQLQELADHTNRFLGDFTSMTALERRALVPSVMFYGWLRHSLKLLFWTMPSTRPVVGSIIGQLGKLHANEIRAIFGDDAPEWLFTYAVLGRTKDGQPIGINAARFIPFVNAVADPGTIDNPYAAPLLMAPPPAQAVINAATARDLFSGRRARETLGGRTGMFLQTAVGSPFAPLRVGQRVLDPKEYEAEDPAWRRLLEQTLPVPRRIPYSPNGGRSSASGWVGSSSGSSGAGGWR